MMPQKNTLTNHYNYLSQFLFFAFILFNSTQLNAQVGINNTDPKASLDISASNPSSPTNTDGMLVPRVSDFPSSAPTADQNGMLIYLTTTVGLNTPGFYYWNQTTTSWLKVMDENAVVIQNWDRTGTTLSPETTGDDLSFGSNEHITLENAFSTPDAFIHMYLNSSGSNVERTILTEHVGSSFDLNFNPVENSFLFKTGSTNKVTIDLDAVVPLDVLGSISLGNIGNKYTLPNDNGNANQYLQTDGTGAASWVDIPVDTDHDWYQIGTTNPPSAITNDIFTQGRLAVGSTTISNSNAVIQASKAGQSYIQVTSTTNGVVGLNLERTGFQNYALFSSAITSTSILAFTRANNAFNGWNLDFMLDENGDFTIAAVAGELDNKLGIGLSMIGFTEANKVTIKGHGDDATTTALKIKNLSENDIFDFKNSGELTIGGATTGYTLSSSRGGTANQIMQTDGSGNVTWVNNPSASFWSRTGTNLDVATSGDDINFTSDQTSITFPASVGAPSPMINMFSSGTLNSNRMVLAHSPTITNYGLEYEDTTDIFRFLGAGNPIVEIDLTSGFPLRVYGTARAVDFESDTTTYPDYVFENYFNGFSEINNDYTFKTLSEIEIFIKEEGHLPGVKSYKEIKEKGMVINLAETSVTNLEKIEELFLYAIEMRKENDQLKEKQKILEKRLAKIEALLQKKN